MALFIVNNAENVIQHPERCRNEFLFQSYFGTKAVCIDFVIFHHGCKQLSAFHNITGVDVGNMCVLHLAVYCSALPH